jgi:hypothetical protein
VFEEIKALTHVDLGAAVRRGIPSVLDKMTSTSAFITGK